MLYFESETVLKFYNLEARVLDVNGWVIENTRRVSFAIKFTSRPEL